jgi:hypothetical protein
MKQLLLLFTTFFILGKTKAAILNVSNNPAYPTAYSTVMGAVTAASVGDTIYIYPSAQGYNENVNLTKRLVLIGGGVFSGRVSTNSTYVQQINIENTAANGTVIMGIDIYSYLRIGYSNGIQHQNITITDCKFREGSDGIFINVSNLLFENNIVPQHCSLNLSSIISSSTIIRNNLFFSAIKLASGSQATIENNVFMSNDNSIFAFDGYYNLSNCVVKNNIFYKMNPAASYATINTQFSSNIHYLTNSSIPNTGSSSGNINADPKFVNVPTVGAANFSLAHNYKLQLNSPGKNAGTDGTDLGVWGGLFPINSFFEPPIPRVIDIKLTNATVPVGGQLQVTIKATKAQ